MKRLRLISLLGSVALITSALVGTSYAEPVETLIDAPTVNAVSSVEASTINALSSTQNAVANTDAYQDFCISVITGFPNDDQVARYQFFKLTDELAEDAGADFKQTLTAYQDEPLPTDIPVLEVIELIANPVLRQAAPEVVVASMYHLIDFKQKCDPYVGGQIASLKAFDSSLINSDIVIAEDALYLRQILLDSLSRLGAETDETHRVAMLNYSEALVRSRDAIEFQAYEDDVSDIESLFMEDLDGRLAKSNDIINNEIDREILGDAITISDDLIEDLKRKQKEEDLRTLARILNRY